MMVVETLRCAISDEITPNQTMKGVEDSLMLVIPTMAAFDRELRDER